jgi:hypothetical protein
MPLVRLMLSSVPTGRLQRWQLARVPVCHDGACGNSLTRLGTGPRPDQTAPGSLKRRGVYVTGQNANMVWIVGSSVVFIVVGIILIATHV